MYNISEISEIVNCNRKEIAKPDTTINQLLIDTRVGNFSDESLFFALKGEKSDGHLYLSAAYEKGIRNFVVSYYPPDFLFPSDCNILEVSDTLQALQMLASSHRQKFSYPVIGITGSNGKTIVKEWLTELLQSHFKIVKSPKSFNSQIGVPLSVWEMSEHFDLAIFEAGISQKAEMTKLESILKPTIGIITNIGTAHEEGFRSVEDKLNEKLQLFRNSGLLIYSTDQMLVSKTVEELFPKTKRLSWSKNEKGHADIKFHLVNQSLSLWRVNYNAASFEFECPFRDVSSKENLFHCISLLLVLKISHQSIVNGIRALKPIESRLEIKEGKFGSIIIDDTYNNDLAGLKVALDYLISFGIRDKKTVILSALAQLANPTETYSYIAKLLEQYKIDDVYLIGDDFKKYENLYNLNVQFFESTDAFLAQIKVKSFTDSMILVKGGRVFSFEKIVQRLTNQIHSTRLEIDLEALVHNYNYFKSLLKPSTKMMVMVKASAYGSGSREVARVLQHHNVDYLSVAYADEGVALRQNGISTPIMVMNTTEENFEQLLTWNLEPEVYSISYLSSILTFLANKNTQLNAHLNLDTGMHRLGFMHEDDKILSQILQSQSRIKIKSIYTHLAASDDPEFDKFSLEQLEHFKKWATKIVKLLPEKPLLHALNSSGISRFTEYQLDMVRLGIGLYGIANDDETQDRLHTVASLKTKITQTKKVKKGGSVGYGRMGKVETDKIIAIVSIGYADGYSRLFSNGAGGMIVNKQFAPTIGNVCMDMTMLDITNIDAHEGDEVEVFGLLQSIKKMADSLNIIPYEMLTNINNRVKRTFHF
ncbi:bifunctional UDP-N-acetylmuramoyl-tripeptide:D-alanyl-D-alanine ligase/alanine racemase [Fulvivirgaceae bacterium LMO-SS25]